MLNDYTYEIYDLPNLEAVEQLLQKTDGQLGFNVTIPYKVAILPFLDELSPEAKEVGAVNTILIKDNKKIGYNTDVFGFEKSLFLLKKDHHQTALILGDGGASKAVQYVLKKNGIPFKIVSRKERLNFENLDQQTVAQHHIIIQATPVGTFPNVDDCLAFPFEGLTNQHLVIDLIYNPNRTCFLKQSAEKKAKTLNGLYMLEQQAEKSWQIWNS